MTTTKDIINALVAGDLTSAKKMTSSILDEKIHDVLELSKVEVTEKTYNKKKDEEKLDPVDHSELKGKHKDREDKDIDNDGDVDSSDKYLHKRRKAVSKAIKNESADVYKRPAKVSALGGQKFHAIVDSKGVIVAAGMSEKDAKKQRKFGQKVMELPGAKVGQKIKEDAEVDEGTDADIASLALDIAKMQDRKKDLEMKKKREPKQER